MVTRDRPHSEPTRTVRRAHRPITLLWLVVLLSTISACTFSFTYRQLDWLIPWHISDYISFDNEQRSELEQRLVRKLEWHCRTQLDAYANWFREVHDDALPFTREDLERNYQRSLAFWRVLMKKLTPDITAMLLTASDAQVEELLSNMEQRNRELEKRYVTAGWNKILQRRVERMEEILQRWIGPLTDSQQQAVERWSQNLGQSGEAWMESRRRWQQALEQAFALRAEPEQFATRMHTLFVEPRELWSESYRKEYARLREQTMAMLMEIGANETPEQERYFREQLISWAEDFESLSCSPREMAAWTGS